MQIEYNNAPVSRMVLQGILKIKSTWRIKLFKLLKGGKCFLPENAGKKDILIVYDRICRIEENIPENSVWEVEIIDCSGKIICPGFIDQHVHITGGGGEQGPASRIPEVMLSDLTTAGVTTAVGVLGIDGITRSVSSLLAKACSLQAEGITTYIYTGSYGVPTATLMGKPISDITLIDKVIGIGEIAIADYRSSYPTTQLLRELATEAMVGGMLGGKAGVVHMHVGDGKDGLSPLLKLLDESDFPISMFVPTHLNRNRTLFSQAIEFARKGGNVDLTAGQQTGKGYSVPDAVGMLLGSGINADKVTVSSDGNGSIPEKDGEIGKVRQFFDDIRNWILYKGIGVDVALKLVTSNVAKILKLYPKKGVLSVGSDADVLVLNENDFTIDKVLVMGEIFVDGGKAVRRGKYEKA